MVEAVRGVSLTDAFAPLLVIALPYYGGHIVCKAAVEAAGGSDTTEMPAQCGPYLFDIWQQNQKITLKANPDWTGEKPDVAVVEFYIVSDDQPALLAYEADAFDLARVAASALQSVRASTPDGATLIEARSTRYDGLTININAEPLKDLRMRQAVQHAHDGDAVRLGGFDGAVPRSAGVIQPTYPFARHTNIIASRDVARAQALLAEAGAEGLTLHLIALTDSRSQMIAQIIQASLGEAGITVEIRPTEDAAGWAVGDKTQGDGYESIELVLMSFEGGIEPTENLVWFRPDQIGVYNRSSCDSPDYEDLC